MSQTEKSALANDFFSETSPLPQSTTCEELAILVASHPRLLNLDKRFYRCALNGHVFLILSTIAIVDSSFATALPKRAIDLRLGGLNPTGGIYISREKHAAVGYCFRRAPPPSSISMKGPTIYIPHHGPLSSQDIFYFPKGTQVVARADANSNMGRELVSEETVRRQGFQNVFNQRAPFEFPLCLLVRSYVQRQCGWWGKITISSACILTVTYFSDQSETYWDTSIPSEFELGLECCRELFRLRGHGDSSRRMDHAQVEREIETICTTIYHIVHMQD